MWVQLVEVNVSLQCIIVKVEEELVEECSCVMQECSEFVFEVEKYCDCFDCFFVCVFIGGYIKVLFLKGFGGVLVLGDVVVEIVLIGSDFVVEVKVLLCDIGYIEVGDEVEIVIIIFDLNIQGMLFGLVFVILVLSFCDE